MRNLKKVLSMVLVVAMIASMLVVGAAAAETEKTNYEEAAAVTIGIGIIEGDETGYNYQGLLTREQAAKLIAYMLLGKDTAEALKVSGAPFADVAATRWSAPYIAYLKSQGIISGVSDTEFDPTANVTGIALAKMMLSAVGYGANGEFEGAAWDINTITFANDNGVFDGTLADDLSAPATREEAMLYMFNTLTKVPVVKFNKTFESYYTGKSALDPITGDVDPTETTADDPYYYTLGYSKYLLKQTDVAGGDTDDFGRPAATWTASGVFVADAVANVEPYAVLTGGVDSAALYNVLGKAVVKNLNNAIYGGNAHSITVYVDGIEQTQTRNSMTGAYDTPWVTMVSGEHTNSLTGGGATVELYLSQDVVTGNYSLSVVAFYEHIGEITRVATSGGITTLTIADKGVGGTYTVTSEELDVTGFAKEDMVIFTAATVGSSKFVKSIMAATPISGTYVNYTDAFFSYTIDGAFYGKSTVGSIGEMATYGTGSVYSIYLDGYGNILYAELLEEGETSNQYLYVQLAEAQPYVAGALDGQDAKVALTVLYPNGGKEVVYSAVKTTKIGTTTYYYISVGSDNYAIVADGTLNKIVNKALTSNQPIADVLNGWMRYTVNENGDVALKGLNPSYAMETAVSVDTGKATTGVAGYTANSATTLTLIDADGTALVYTGITNFVNKSGTALVTYGLDSKVVKNITMVVDSLSSQNLALCSMLWSSDVANSIYTYMFYVDGVAQFINLDASLADPSISPFDTGANYVFDLDVTDGVYTATRLTDYINTDRDINGDGIIDVIIDEGPVNAGLATTMNMTTYETELYEWAVVDTIDETYFTTVEVEAGEEFADSIVGKYWGAFGITEVPARTYYFDGNTKVYDCTQTPDGTLDEGDAFIAYVDEDASAAYLGEQYCSIIWIVG